MSYLCRSSCSFPIGLCPCSVGPWRWFHETMLDCCVRLDVVKDEGLTFDQFICLAECNGCSFDVTHRAVLGPSSQFNTELSDHPVPSCNGHSNSEHCLKTRESTCEPRPSIWTSSLCSQTATTTPTSLPSDFNENHFQQSVERVSVSHLVINVFMRFFSH